MLFLRNEICIPVFESGILFKSFNAFKLELPLSLLFNKFFLTFFIGLDCGLTAGVTDRQGMLTPLWHLIPPLGFQSWKDPNNVFRTDKDLKLKSVPTLLRVGKLQRLEEGQCASDDLVEMLFSDED